MAGFLITKIGARKALEQVGDPRKKARLYLFSIYHGAFRAQVLWSLHVSTRVEGGRGSAPCAGSTHRPLRHVPAPRGCRTSCLGSLRSRTRTPVIGSSPRSASPIARPSSRMIDPGHGSDREGAERREFAASDGPDARERARHVQRNALRRCQSTPSHAAQASRCPDRSGGWCPRWPRPLARVKYTATAGRLWTGSTCGQPQRGSRSCSRLAIRGGGGCRPRRPVRGA